MCTVQKRPVLKKEKCVKISLKLLEIVWIYHNKNFKLT